MTCSLALLGAALAEGRLTWDTAQVDALRRAVRAGCIKNPHDSDGARVEFWRILRAHAGMAPPAEAAPERLPAAERRERIAAALRADPQLSNRALGRLVGCSDKTAGDDRKALAESAARIDAAETNRR